MKIQELLREAAQHTRGEGCGPEVEDHLRAAFRQRRRAVWPLWTSAIAAAMALFFWLAPRRDVVSPAPTLESQTAAVAPSEVVVEPGPQVERRRSEKRRPALVKRQARPREVHTDFFALDAAALNGVPDGYVMRVQVPRAAMASFGLPVNQNLDQRIDADLLIGNDGTARAIRFVRRVPIFQ